ncbi:LysR family transcriptional regulator [Pseudoalteromonas tunicata]|uniref:LysR family transcriptional regulator n=1 Tax=Pseudoalteromonas tunicata TaxID=314281 RepID=UPI00273FD2B2|nr:LysR family transcriptional regulator [Pseudoalteromonas tunicata]MDP4984411.1 LysR family transcriptional regulator [Pseudoalteromonas tunicata]
MDIEALRTLLAFVETGSFTRAGLQIHRTQSAISMQMKKLEQELGKTLFIKHGRNLVLSAEGLLLARDAKQLVHLHDQSVLNIKQPKQRLMLRLGCPDDYAKRVLPDVVALLHQEFSNLELSISTASSIVLREQLDQGLLDLAIVTRAPNSEEGYLLQTAQGVWLKHPQFKLKPEHSLPIVVFQKDCKFHQAAVEGLLKLSQPFHIVANCASASVLNGIVDHGLAITAMADISQSQYAEQIEAPFLPALPSIAIVLISALHPLNPMSSAQAKQLSERYQTLVNKKDA